MSEHQGSQAHASTDTEGAYFEIRSLAFFEGIPDEELWKCVVVGDMELVSYERDVFVADPNQQGGNRSPHKIVLVSSGQVAVAVFDPNKIAERKQSQEEYEQMSAKERRDVSSLRPPPLSRVARKNLATFMCGDLFNSAALGRGSAGDVAFYTVEPSATVSFSHDSIANLAAQFPFMEERLRQAIEVSRQRLQNIQGVKQEILDFFIRHGISVSGEMVRVRQLDSCIDCKQCEQACEERYGARRLTLGGYQLGMLDFVFSCRTCTDQRCIPACDYDSIRFDPEIREVVINETSCVGCTLCAQNCPYEAIEMVNVEDPSNPAFKMDFKLRLEQDGALKFGGGAGRVAQARRVANKCDHCYSYATQACVSACPTGSLIEVSAYSLFQERSPMAQASVVAKDTSPVRLDGREILPIKPFTEGIGVRDSGMAKTKRGRIGPVLVWGIAITTWFVAFAEIMLRLYRPTSSVQYALLRSQDQLAHIIALGKVRFIAGSPLSVYCGYVGTGLMLLAILYVPLRRIPIFRSIASNTMWFDFHLMAGTMGPAFIVLHSALKLDNWVSSAFWSMAIVFVSGVIGRYLYTQVPDMLNGRELEELDHQRALKHIGAQYPQTVAVIDGILLPHKTRAENVAKHAGMLRSFFWLTMEDLKRPRRRMQRKRLFKRSGVPREVRAELERRTGRMLLVNRRRVLAPRAQLLLHSWKKVHIPFSIVMALISSVHIWLAY